jgi:hypothetical protein
LGAGFKRRGHRERRGAAAGDGAAIAYEDNAAIRASTDCELLLFDMA